MTNYDLVLKAISDKVSLVGTYEGLERVFSPHILGTKNDEPRVFGYQTGGYTSNGPVVPDLPKNWRCFRLDALTDLVLSPEQWRTISTAGRGSSCIDTVIAEVSL